MAYTAQFSGKALQVFIAACSDIPNVIARYVSCAIIVIWDLAMG